MVNASVMRQTGLVCDIANEAPGKQFLLQITDGALPRCGWLVAEGCFEAGKDTVGW
jgi:hypothetical protein